MLYAIVAVLIIIVDQWSKYLAGHLVLGEGIKTLIPGVVSIVNVHNEGAAFGFLSGANPRIWFVALCGVFTVIVIVALAANLIKGPLGRWSAVCVAAGGIGNCIDRIIFGYVQDMIKIELFDFAIFNVADIFITVFCFLFILYIIFGGEKKGSEKKLARASAPEEDDFEDEYEDEEPVKHARKPAAAKRGVAALEDEDARGPSKEELRKEAEARRMDEYERFKAQRAARQQAQDEAVTARPAESKNPTRRSSSAAPSDPFAEWERASQAVEAKRRSEAAARVGISPAPQSDFSANPAPVNPAPVRVEPENAPVSPKAPSTPSKSLHSDTDFSLDDILNEYK